MRMVVTATAKSWSRSLRSGVRSLVTTELLLIPRRKTFHPPDILGPFLSSCSVFSVRSVVQFEKAKPRNTQKTRNKKRRRRRHHSTGAHVGRIENDPAIRVGLPS